MNTIKWIGNTLGKRIWMIGVLSVLQSAMALSSIVFALLMRQAIDSATSGWMTAFEQAVIALIVLVLLQIGMYALNRFLEDDTRAVIDNRLRQRVFRGILKKEYAEINRYHTGELMNRITSDTAVITDGAVTLAPSLVSIVVRICGVLFVMYSIEPWIAIVFLLAGCAVAGVSILPRKWQKNMHKRVQEADGNVRSFLQEALESLIVIRAFGCEEKIESTSKSKMAHHRKMRRNRSNAFNVFGTGLRLSMQFGYLFGFIWCGLGIVKGSITYGTLTAVIQLIGQIQTPFFNIGSVFPKYASMLASAERLMELTDHMETESSKAVNATREEVYEQMESIHFDGVSFAYNSDRPVLENETFIVNKGEFIAVIGSSGIGKSTIMKLILSVYQPDEGSISVRLKDGTLRVDELPSGMFAYVPQGNYLMSGPIWEVVGFAEQTDCIDKDKVEWACKVACAHEFIEKLPNGYDTELGERGSGLSEGQMQRLAVARAIYSGCPILLLDEATSALDADTEQRMISSLKELCDYTVLLVTHRRDAWELCDRTLAWKE